MPGYGLLPAEDGSGLIPWRYVERQMRAARNYWVVTASRSGVPHAAPVWGLWHKGGFFFATEAASRKARNLAENPQLIVHLESGDDVVILEGTGERVQKAQQLRALDSEYSAKYAVQLADSPTFTLHIETAFAWYERDFPGSATRWKFKSDAGDGA